MFRAPIFDSNVVVSSSPSNNTTTTMMRNSPNNSKLNVVTSPSTFKAPSFVNDEEENGIDSNDVDGFNVIEFLEKTKTSLIDKNSISEEEFQRILSKVQEKASRLALFSAQERFFSRSTNTEAQEVEQQQFEGLANKSKLLSQLKTPPSSPSNNTNSNNNEKQRSIELMRKFFEKERKAKEEEERREQEEKLKREEEERKREQEKQRKEEERKKQEEQQRKQMELENQRIQKEQKEKHEKEEQERKQKELERSTIQVSEKRKRQQPFHSRNLMSVVSTLSPSIEKRIRDFITLVSELQSHEGKSLPISSLKKFMFSIKKESNQLLWRKLSDSLSLVGGWQDSFWNEEISTTTTTTSTSVSNDDVSNSKLNSLIEALQSVIRNAPLDEDCISNSLFPIWKKRLEKVLIFSDDDVASIPMLTNLFPILNKLISAVSRSRPELLKTAQELENVIRGNGQRDDSQLFLTDQHAALQIVAAMVIERAPSVKDEEQFLPLAHLAVYLCFKFAELKDILIAHLYRSCSMIAPVMCSLSNLSISKWKEAMGFEKFEVVSGSETQESFENVSSYVDRSIGMITLFGGIIQTTDMPNSIGLEEGWIWISRILNLKPRKLTLILLERFLKIAGSQLQQRYKSQFKKLCLSIKTDILSKTDSIIADAEWKKLLQEDDISEEQLKGSIVNLNSLVELVLSNQSIPPLKGYE